MTCLDTDRPHHVCVIGTDEPVRSMVSAWLRSQSYSVAECERPPGGSYESCSADASDIIVLDADGALPWALAELERLRAAGVYAPTIIICPPSAPVADLADVERHELAYPVPRPMTLGDFERVFLRALEPATSIDTICRISREMRAPRIARKKTEIMNHGIKFMEA